MAQIPTWDSGSGIKWSDIYNVVNGRALGTVVSPGTGVDISDFAGQTWAPPGLQVPAATTGSNISIKTYFSGNSLPGGGGDYPGDAKPVEPFSTVAMDEETHRCNFKVEYTAAKPFYFTDSGRDRENYNSNDNYYVTFYSPTGLRFWIHSGGFNYMDFEEFSYSQYDRLGIQVSNTDEKALENFQSTPTSTASVLYPWLQTSSSRSPPWGSSFGGGRYNATKSLNGYIFPSNTRRAESLGLREGVSLDLNFNVIRFYFSADGGSEKRGWYFSVYPLPKGGEPGDPGKEIPK